MTKTVMLVHMEQVGFNGYAGQARSCMISTEGLSKNVVQKAT